MQPLLLWKSNDYYIFSLCDCTLGYPACNANAPFCHLWPFRLYSIFPHYLINGTIFEGEEERIIEHKMYFEIIYNVYLKYFVLSRIQRDLIINLHRFPCKVPVILVTAQSNLNFVARFSGEKKFTSNFVKIRPMGEELFHADGRTDRHDSANIRF